MELNYGKNNIEEVPFEQYMEKYRAMDPAEAGRRSGIPYDSEKQCFTMRMMQRTYLISWPEFEVCVADPENTDYAPLRDETDAKIFAIRFLLNGIESRGTDKFLTFREVPGAELYFTPFDGRCLKRLAFGFGFKLAALTEIFERLDAKKLSYGDVSCEIEFINNYYVRFILWAGDDEFPPSAQILFSDNFPVAFEPYDLAVVGDISINTFKKLQ